MKQIYILITISCVLWAPSCSPEKTGKETVRTVKTATVDRYGEEQTFTFPGKIKAASDVNLAFRISGLLAKVYVETGQYVKKDQLLAEIDPRDYRLQLAATEAEYKQVKAEAERIIELYEKGGVTPNDYDKAVSGLKQITAKYEAHTHALADTKLRAPFDGYVQKRFFEANETVGAGIPVVAVINAGIPEVEINLPSADFILRDRFETYHCTVDLYPGRTFPLELIGIAPKANLNQLYTMRLRLKGGEAHPPLPSPGMAAMVSIHCKSDKAEWVCIPLSALFEAHGAASVWIYDGNSQTVSLRAVKPHKIRTDGVVVIDSGLEAGKVIVAAGVHALQPGEKVKPLPAVSATNEGGLL
jgi:RND family efflux transporter MFP subunit